MGRVVGDGVFYCYVQDVVVLPELQGQGMTGMFRVVPGPA